MFAFAPAPVPSLAIRGSAERFPVRRIWCVGRNYRKHALEMGGDPDRQPPFFFAKPSDAIVDARPELDAEIAYPPQTADLHHEVELLVAIGPSGEAFGYAVSVDLTRRDLQATAKASGRPWALAKGFDQSAPVGCLSPGSAPPSGRLWLDVDGERRQEAALDEMIWNVPEILQHLRASVDVRPGDVILTGTPAGVGPIRPGQRVRAGISGLDPLAFTLK